MKYLNGLPDSTVASKGVWTSMEDPEGFGDEESFTCITGICLLAVASTFILVSGDACRSSMECLISDFCLPSSR